MSRLELLRAPATRQGPPGRLEVMGAEDGLIVEPSLSVRRLSASEKADRFIKGTRDCQKGKLQVLGLKEVVVIQPTKTTPRPGSVAGRHESARRKVYTPTKQILLCTAKASPEINDIAAKDLVDKKSTWNPVPELRSSNSMLENKDEKDKIVGKTGNTQSNVIDNHNANERLLESADEDCNTDCSSEEQDEKERAPIELMGEFLKAIMDQDYKLSGKLCQMILLYEPENSEAKQFIPLIEQKILIEGSEQNAENEDDEETDEDSSESEDDTDGGESEDRSDETSDSSSDSEEEL